MDFAAMFMKVCTKNGLVFSFMLIGIITLITYKLSGLTKGKVHGSAIAIFAGFISAVLLPAVLKAWLLSPCLPVLA